MSLFPLEWRKNTQTRAFASFAFEAKLIVLRFAVKVFWIRLKWTDIQLLTQSYDDRWEGNKGCVLGWWSQTRQTLKHKEWRQRGDTQRVWPWEYGEQSRRESSALYCLIGWTSSGSGRRSVITEERKDEERMEGTLILKVCCRCTTQAGAATRRTASVIFVCFIKDLCKSLCGCISVFLGLLLGVCSKCLQPTAVSVSPMSQWLLLATAELPPNGAYACIPTNNTLTNSLHILRVRVQTKRGP